MTEVIRVAIDICLRWLRENRHQFLGPLLKRFVIGRDDYRSVLTANEKPCFALLAELRRLR